MARSRFTLAFDHHNMVPGPAGVATPQVIYKSEDGILLCYGITKPTDDDAGYAKGCVFMHTDGAEGSMFYVNEGDADDCNFDAALVTTDDVITLAMMSDNSVDSDQYVDGSIDLAHMSSESVDSDQYVDGSIDLAHMSNNSVDSDQYVDASIDSAHLNEGLIQTATKVFTADEIRALGTAVDLVAAPGAGKAIEWISAYLFLNYSGGALSAVTGNIRIGTMNQGAWANTFISAAADRVCISHSGAENDDADTYFINTALNIKLASNPTGGTSTSTLTVVVSYRIHDFN